MAVDCLKRVRKMDSTRLSRGTIASIMPLTYRYEKLQLLRKQSKPNGQKIRTFWDQIRLSLCRVQAKIPSGFMSISKMACIINAELRQLESVEKRDESFSIDWNGNRSITACASPDSDNICIITDSVYIRSECTRLLAY
jgi:hypothetical protein